MSTPLTAFARAFRNGYRRSNRRSREQVDNQYLSHPVSGTATWWQVKGRLIAVRLATQRELGYSFLLIRRPPGISRKMFLRRVNLLLKIYALGQLVGAGKSGIAYLQSDFAESGGVPFLTQKIFPIKLPSYSGRKENQLSIAERLKQMVDQYGALE